jgi:uncharacterized protein YecT (DUF1311 family)
VTRAAFLGLALLVSAPALAQQAPQRPRQDDLPQLVGRNIRGCIGASREMAVIARCMDSQRAVVAPRLAAAEAALLATQSDPARRAALTAVQAAWANYRDLRCDFAGTNPERGAEAPADRAACLLEFDLARTMEIGQLLAPPTPPQPQRR